jgi:hypothetical protein
LDGHSEIRQRSVSQSLLAVQPLSASAVWLASRCFILRYRLSVFGYTALDQVMSPFYMCAWLWFVDRYGGLRRLFVSTDDQHQSFGEAFQQTWEESKADGCSGNISLFIYRFLSAVRVMACKQHFTSSRVLTAFWPSKFSSAACVLQIS